MPGLNYENASLTFHVFYLGDLNLLGPLRTNNFLPFLRKLLINSIWQFSPTLMTFLLTPKGYIIHGRKD